MSACHSFPGTHYCPSTEVSLVARRPSGRSCMAKHSSLSSLLLPQSRVFQGEFEPLAWEGGEVNTGRATVDLSMQTDCVFTSHSGLRIVCSCSSTQTLSNPCGTRKGAEASDRLSVPTPGPPG